MAIYNCSISIIKEAPVIGYGPGDVQKELNSCYEKFNTQAFKKERYNSHNQYLDYLLSFGVIGFIIILYCFLYYLKMARKNPDNKVYFNFLILFYFTFLTENILVRNTGMVLFVTFNCLLAYPILEKQKINSKNH